ncbi:MAG: aromatic ring-hydroxylating oxygenase subunit alpha, partial [Candidatus Binatia bacterium]
MDAATRSVLAFPQSPYPTGWFQVGWSDQLLPKETKLLRYFGQDIVLWRTESGRLQALDAYCLHLGGNLGVKGCVDGEDIVCPWHGWHWDGDGRNTQIPYDTQRCKSNLRITAWPVCEWYGIIFVWHDRAGRAPLWPMPVLERLGGYEYHPIEKDCWTIKARVQNVMDNVADPAHFVYVHGAAEMPNFIEHRFEEHHWKAKAEQTFGGDKPTWLTPNGAVTVTVDYLSFGIGTMMAFFPELFGSGYYIGSTTPIDDTHCDHWFTITTRRATPPEFHRMIVEMQRKLTQMDFFTWENMKILDAPNLTPEESKYM